MKTTVVIFFSVGGGYIDGDGYGIDVPATLFVMLIQLMMMMILILVVMMPAVRSGKQKNIQTIPSVGNKDFYADIML
ncbi:hypothetical protein DPMN_037065 [Dreissena polymorpha]|uniref:Uncharacterized protein n=1 Tax=Dreissena polymorpha TaxID=45954 RepID=A0A9D4RPG2_DREPO|nr:hypothetical protein DPMN_037065 [Dreissena polymorpha]